MITAIIQNEKSGVPVVATGTLLAEKFKKDFRQVLASEVENLAEFCEREEVSFLLMQLAENRASILQKQLNACHDLRIPYIFYKNDFKILEAKKILVPVTFLEEEIEKAQFAAAFGRFFGTSITVLQANDYGSKAKITVRKMINLLDKFSLAYEVKIARRDSFKLEKEAVEIAEKENYDLLLISASRTYGLDDVIFGPHERKTVLQSRVPVILVNPRADLYALCD
ncbi:MAG: universal stress protein [Prevotellaceae bacterium]|jgi:nucleotide-binding universal stress UspA family protein|nr:universal stress protein [Prevotellaceae bacterium]